LVAAARKTWGERLVDLTRRNNLLYYRPLKLGSYDLDKPEPDALLDVLAGGSALLTRLVPPAELVSLADPVMDPADVTPAQLGASRRLIEVQRKATENFEERGLETMFLAYGLAGWTAKDGGRDAEAAIVLCPVRLEGKEQRRAVRRRGDLEINPVLVHVLERDFGMADIAEQLAAALPEDEEHLHDTQTYEDLFAKLEQAAKHVGGFRVVRRAVIGNFSFQKLAMVKDLERWGDAMAENEVIAALAGDTEAKLALGHDDPSESVEMLDEEPPAQQFLVLDADSSQHLAIKAVLAGKSLIIAGPPGTGKSQTIGNLIAELVAQGRRVLFVAEKRAAIEMVKRRLVRVGLGDLLLDLHGAVSKREVMAQFAEVFERIRKTGLVNAGGLLEEYTHQRERLRSYAALLSRPVPPTGVDLETLHGKLLQLPRGATCQVRWRGPDLDRLEPTVTREARELLREASSHASLFLGTDASLWSRAKLDSPAATERAIDLTRHMIEVSVPAVDVALTETTRASGLPRPTTVGGVGEFSAFLSRINGLLVQYDARLFAEDLEALQAALLPAAGSFLARLFARLRPSFRSARSRVSKLRRAPASAGTLLSETTLAGTSRARWRELGAVEVPHAVSSAPELARALDALRADLRELSSLFEPGVLPGGSLEELRLQVGALARDEQKAIRVARLRRIAARLRELGLAPLLAELGAVSDAVLWPDVFEHAWLRSARDRAFLESSELAVFDGRTHAEVVREFRRLDRAILEVAVARVRRAHSEHAVAAMNAYPDEAINVRHEAFKQKAHKPVRKLAVEAPHVLTAIKPCWMASPLSVSQLLLGSRDTPFDVVIFDEASQVLPEDAVTALLRARVAVVAGDRHQLPPTPFFVAGQDDGDEDADGADATAGHESVLDAMRGFAPERALQWHYRSEDERLIAFSNHEIYGLGLVTFPGVGRWSPISHVLVPQILADGEELSSSAEVERVVELILEHARTRPDETLGVITMGLRHKRRIEGRLDQVRKEQPELDEFFDSEDHRERQERFFVKNLENVQGDERDAVILSIGYGKDRAGRLIYRFGPLLYDGGERRLNVAVTRAKRRMTLVSSFSFEDMDDAKLHSRGMRLLKQYLRFAASGGAEIHEQGAAAAERNPFELDVEDALREQGIEVVPQYGVSRYRIDLVAMHPKLPGRRVLAIECDGASYHSTPTVRDRDRLRQEHLERLGWRFVRIWSTDWYTRRDEEVARVVAAYQAALEMDASRGKTASRATRLERAEVSTSVQPRGPRPYFIPNLSVDRYDYQTRIALVRWIASDGRLRTDEELLLETARVLGFDRVGKRIREWLEEAVEGYRRATARGAP
jgi:very-short-patch-repair endonuclease/DNA polymerase III delta prime subunit